ncbi:MAG: microcin ABC transporter permease, partial [Pseudomonadota bacterium]
MGAYILRRLLLIVPTLFGILVLNFVLIQFLPGGPIEQVISNLQAEGGVSDRITGGGNIETGGGGGGVEYEGAQGLPADFIEDLERQYGLDRPPLERFG